MYTDHICRPWNRPPSYLQSNGALCLQKEIICSIIVVRTDLHGADAGCGSLPLRNLDNPLSLDTLAALPILSLLQWIKIAWLVPDYMSFHGDILVCLFDEL